MILTIWKVASQNGSLAILVRHFPVYHTRGFLLPLSEWHGLKRTVVGKSALLLHSPAAVFSLFDRYS